jgi:penicillin-binding protein 2
LYQRRIKILLLGFGACVLIAFGRLGQLQLLDVETYQEQIRDMLLRPERSLPFVRGRILTADGVVLASDQPSWDVCLHYRMLSGDSEYLNALIDERLGRKERGIAQRRWEEKDHILQQMNHTWELLESMGDGSREELLERRDAICRLVERERRYISDQHNYEVVVRAERMCHPLAFGLNDQDQINAKLLFEDYEWVKIQPSTRREFSSSPAYSHLIGRVGGATSEIIEASEFRDDPLRHYLPGEPCGITGVEGAFENLLRGSRGRLLMDRDQQVLPGGRDPEHGRDVVLTLRADLQEDIFGIVQRRLNQYQLPGGAAVVVHVPTREVVAMVSCPGFSLGRLKDAGYYQQLRNDTLRLPLLFRAANAIYPAGSIVKPVGLLAGLAAGKVTTGTQFDCQGYRFPEHPTQLREWMSHSTHLPAVHGLVHGETAIQHSCNIYFWHLAEAIGIDALANTLSQVGLGQPSGVGLAEDVSGILPDSGWIASNTDRRGATVADARNVVIGQGDLAVTPLQAANMVASMVTGRHQLLTLVRDDGRARPVSRLKGVTAGHLAAVRRGMFRVVNEQGGTAYKTARLDRSDYVLSGKTGSAQCPRRPLAYSVKYRLDDEAAVVEMVRAEYAQGANEKIRLTHRDRKVQILKTVRAEVWPPPEMEEIGARPSHAWFAGILQPAGAAVGVEPEYAFVLMLEFGGSGGRMAGPVAKEIAEAILDSTGGGGAVELTSAEAVLPGAMGGMN